MKKNNIDVLDSRLIVELDKDASQSYSQLARRVRANKNTVRFRVERLEHSGIIKQYYTVIDSTALGLQNYRAMLRLQYVTPEKISEILAKLSSFSEVWWLGRTKGRWDIAIVFWVRDALQLNKVWSEFNAGFRPFIAESFITPYIWMRQYSFPLKGASRDTELITGNMQKQSVDEEDRRLLSYIATRPRESVLDVAKKTGLTSAQVVYRKRRLERIGVIKGYKVSVDLSKLGLMYHKFYFFLNDTSRIEELREFIRRMPACYYFDDNIGIDLEPSFFVSSEEELQKILNSILERFGSIIQRYDTITYSQIVKNEYMPSLD
jgi:DNA-binding Lrp family transcriptional regulator